MMKALANGDWLSIERMRRVCAIMLTLYALCFAALYATSNGRVDAFDRPLGTDFSEVWVAGVFVNEGHPELPFDNAAHEARQREFFTPTSGFFGWCYPPYFLALAALFALLPYWLALLTWQFSTLPLYLAAVRARLPRDGTVMLAALAYPAVFINFGHGHNGFLSAGLLGGGLLLLERRPVLAGLCLGLLAYKPQFGIVVPIALIAGGHWRCAAAAAATVAAMTLGTWAAFGTQTWVAFFDSLAFTRQVVIEQGSTGWHKLQSAFSATRMLGGSIAAAYAVQAAVTLACMAAIALLWRSKADMRLKAGAAMVAALLSTPYCIDYDMMLLGPALALAVSHGMERGFAPYEKSALAFVWMMPLLARNVALLTYVPLGVLTMAAFLALLLARALPAPARPSWLRWDRGAADVAAFPAGG